MTRRAISQYNWAKLQFDERILKKHITAPRRLKIKHVAIHHMTIVGDGKGSANDACYNVWQNRQASAHYGVDGDDIMQFVWDGNAAWATANPIGNHAGISIEHANTSREPGWKVSDKTMENGARLTAQLHAVYGLGRPVKDKTVRKHKSFFSTACPGPYLGGTEWSEYVEMAQRHYDDIAKGTPTPVTPAPKPDKPKSSVVRWHSTAFLNMWGDDGAVGTATFSKRLPKMIDDLTEGRPEVIGVCEVRTGQEPAVTKALKSEGYALVAYSHRLGIYRLKGATKAASTGFYEYPTQNRGAIEGILRARIKVNGSWAHFGVTHLDYRDGFDQGRVKQIGQGHNAMASFGKRWQPTDWQKRTTIMGDFNSESWVLDELKKLGYKDAKAGAVIDYIAVDDGRPVLESSKDDTNSDHPIVKATVGKYA